MEDTNLTIAFWAFLIIANVRFAAGQNGAGWYATVCALAVLIAQVIRL